MPSNFSDGLARRRSRGHSHSAHTHVCVCARRFGSCVWVLRRAHRRPGSPANHVHSAIRFFNLFISRTAVFILNQNFFLFILLLLLLILFLMLFVFPTKLCRLYCNCRMNQFAIIAAVAVRHCRSTLIINRYHRYVSTSTQIVHPTCIITIRLPDFLCVTGAGVDHWSWNDRTNQRKTHDITHQLRFDVESIRSIVAFFGSSAFECSSNNDNMCVFLFFLFFAQKYDRMAYMWHTCTCTRHMRVPPSGRKTHVRH